MPPDAAESKQDRPSQDGDDDATILSKLDAMQFPDAVQGEELYNFMGGRVIESTTPTGDVVAVKVNTLVTRSEADMMQYAATHGVLAPRVRGVYDIIATRHLARAMVSDRVPGVPLEEVWESLGPAQRAAIVDQLRDQLARMRANTQPFIKRVGRQPTRNVYNGLRLKFCGPFADEEEFDKWGLERIWGGPLDRFKWRRFLSRERKRWAAENKGSGGREFVLTHSDLTPRNILVHNGTITGMIDWERSGFFPEYAEFAFATLVCYPDDEWWLEVLGELLPPCSKQRLEFTHLIETQYCHS